MIAASVHGLPETYITKEQREDVSIIFSSLPSLVTFLCSPQNDGAQGKRIVYGLVYGIGPKGLAEKMGVSQAEAVAFMDRFKARFPG
jgi:hypothetical protein